MRMRICTFQTALVLISASATPVLADIAPPPEETCTVAKQQSPTSECLACNGEYDQTDRCSNLLAPYCFTKVCQTRGTATWTEIMCRTKDANAPVVPSDTMNLVTATGYPLPVVPAGMVTTAPSTCMPYTPPTPSTGDTSSGCSVADRKSATRALGSLALLLTGVALVTLRRRLRRR